MTLSKTAKGIVAAIIAIWMIAVAGMVAVAAGNSSTSTFAAAGSLERNIAGVEGLGLNATALSIADIYGEEYVAAAIICPGETTESINQNFGIGTTDLEELELGAEGVPAGTSYLALQTADGAPEFDQIDATKVELCAVPLAGYFDARSMMPMTKIEPGFWALMV